MKWDKKDNFILVTLLIFGSLTGGVASQLMKDKTSSEDMIRDREPASAKNVVQEVKKEETIYKKAPSMVAVEKNNQLEIPAGEFGDHVKEYKLAAHYNELKDHFSPEELGQDMLTVTTLLELHEMAGSDVSKFVDEKMQKLKDNPDKALKLMAEAFETLPDKFSNEKQQLLQFAEKLDTADADKVDFFTNEMKRPLGHDRSGKKGVNQFNPTVALKSLAKVLKRDPASLDNHVREALDSHGQDQKTQKALLHFYGRYNPKASKKLKKEMGF